MTSNIAPAPYSTTTAAQEAAEAFWDRFGWNREWNTPSVDDLAKHIEGYLDGAYGHGAEAGARHRGAA